MILNKGKSMLQEDEATTRAQEKRNQEEELKRQHKK